MPSSVDLPEPLRPMTATVWPWGTRKEMSLSAVNCSSGLGRIAPSSARLTEPRWRMVNCLVRCSTTMASQCGSLGRTSRLGGVAIISVIERLKLDCHSRALACGTPRNLSRKILRCANIPDEQGVSRSDGTVKLFQEDSVLHPERRPGQRSLQATKNTDGTDHGPLFKP